MKNQCFLCRCGENLVPFDQTHFEKARRMAMYRKYKNHKYGDIDFPTTMENAMYHPECYGKFVVLKAKYKEEFNMMLQREGVSMILKIYELINYDILIFDNYRFMFYTD